MFGIVTKNVLCKLCKKEIKHDVWMGLSLAPFISSGNQLFHTPLCKHYNHLPLYIFARNEKQLGIICEDNKYDFTLQEIRDMKEILVIKPVRSFLLWNVAVGEQAGEVACIRDARICWHILSFIPLQALASFLHVVVVCGLSVQLWWNDLLCSLGGWDPGRM